ncbi:hypothetical protein GQ600_27415 [Phytophthora cactorum]|nr:hypothetical protein GQ600_27415 [Phytophthora cactorum]
MGTVARIHLHNTRFVRGGSGNDTAFSIFEPTMYWITSCSPYNGWSYPERACQRISPPRGASQFAELRVTKHRETALLRVHFVLFGRVDIKGLRPVGSEHDGSHLNDYWKRSLLKWLQNGWNVGALITDDAG